MQDELLQFKLQKVLTLVDLPYGKRAIRTNWVYKNKKDERGIMDVKSAFLYGKIEEEVYVFQPPGFEDPEFLDRVYKVEKSLYGLYQAPRAWYETLSTYLLENGFQRGTIDKTLFIKKVKGELTFFLGLQVKQKEDGIFISQDKYLADILREFSFIDVRTANTPMDTKKPLLKDSDGDDVDVHLYRSIIGSLMYLTLSRPDIMFASDSDYARASLDRKSTTGGCQLLGCKLISWQCKSKLWLPLPLLKLNMWLLLVAVDKIRKAVWLDLVIPIVEFVRGKSAD
ncbi:putative ribonuclease H-like domain-containing protein [Tanacetum coccineum]